MTSWSERSTPALLSIASVLMSPPPSANSTRPRWVKPRLPPSPTTRQRKSAPFTRTASLALSPTSALRSCARLHERADAAVPQRGRRARAGGSDTSSFGRERARRPSGMPSRLRTSGVIGDRLGGARVHAAARRDARAVVVGPRRSGRARTGAAVRRTTARGRDRVQEDVAVVERGDELDVLGEQHAVAEHVARHVADADDGEVGRRCTSMPSWRKWRVTDTHAPFAVIPSSLWS